MSDNLPTEIQGEIIRRLPVKLLVQVRSVCKAWKSLIDSPHFIADYSTQHPQLQHLLVRYDHLHVSLPTYLSLVDDHTFPKQRVSLTPPLLVKMLRYPSVIGSSHGLLCLCGYYGGSSDLLGKDMAVLWNPSIRKAVAVALPNVADSQMYTTVLGYGVCLETTDPKIIKITQIDNWNDMEIVTCIPWQVEVFTLSTRAWRTPHSTNLPRISIQFGCFQVVVVDGSCYWLATDRSATDVGFESYNLIISFHMTREEFTEVNLPDRLLYDGSMDTLHISNLRESLVMLEHYANLNAFYVWLMDAGVSKPFTKLFTISPLDATLLSVLEFRKSGEPVIEIEIADNDADPSFVPSLLAVYEPKTKHIHNLGNGTGSFYVHSYSETLLLFDRPNFTIFDKGKCYIAKQSAEIRSLLKHTSSEMQDAHEMKCNESL